VRATGCPFEAPVGDGLLGRVIDGLGKPLDEFGPLVGAARSRWPAARTSSRPCDLEGEAA
jgi:flagellar biosynthesis/type III secretory pathway ATPase